VANLRKFLLVIVLVANYNLGASVTSYLHVITLYISIMSSLNLLKNNIGIFLVTLTAVYNLNFYTVTRATLC